MTAPTPATPAPSPTVPTETTHGAVIDDLTTVANRQAPPHAPGPGEVAVYVADGGRLGRALARLHRTPECPVLRTRSYRDAARRGAAHATKFPLVIFRDVWPLEKTQRFVWCPRCGEAD